MGCFPCSSNYKKQYKKRKNHDTSDNNNNVHRSTRNINDQNHAQISPDATSTKLSPQSSVKDGPAEVVSSYSSDIHDIAKASDAKDYSTTPDSSPSETDDFKAKKFPLNALVVATENFNEEYILGEGGFGKVYKGRLQDTGEVVAIKQLNTDGCQGIREFVVEVLTLSNAKDPNLVKLIGYCAEGDQRLLIYEYMPLGSLEDHLHGPRANRKLLDWNIRMKIVVGAAKGLQYLHNKMNPPIIYRDLKCSNILLGEGYNPKLSDFGLAKVGPTGTQTHVSTRVMGTYGYCAPEYAATGYLTFKSDIYSFGVFLLEIITGRRAIDNRRHGPETNLAIWAKPMFKDRKQFRQMADPALEGKYPVKGLYQALAIAAMCTNEKPALRPLIDEIVTAFSYLASQIYDPNVDPIQNTHRRANSSRRYVLDLEERCASQCVESERRTKSES